MLRYQTSKLQFSTLERYMIYSVKGYLLISCISAEKGKVLNLTCLIINRVVNFTKLFIDTPKFIDNRK